MAWLASRIELGPWPFSIDMGGVWLRNCDIPYSFVFPDLIWFPDLLALAPTETYQLDVSDGGFADALSGAAGGLAIIAGFFGAPGLASVLDTLANVIPDFDGHVTLRFLGVGMKKPCREAADEEDLELEEDQRASSYPAQSVGWGLMVNVQYNGRARIGGQEMAVAGWLPLGPIAQEWEHCSC